MVLTASGIANGAGSRDQESVGEAVNAYYGATLWAIVIGDTDIKNYARLLLASEQHAAQVSLRRMFMVNQLIIMDFRRTGTCTLRPILQVATSLTRTRMFAVW